MWTPWLFLCDGEKYFGRFQRVGADCGSCSVLFIEKSNINQKAVVYLYHHNSKTPHAMIASAIFTAAHKAARKAHTPQFGDTRSYREVFAVCLRAAHVDARRAIELPLPCASFYTAQQWNETTREQETVFFTSQQQLKQFVGAAIGKTLGVYSHVSAWWGSAEAMRRDLAVTGRISAKSLRGKSATDAEYKELDSIDSSAYVGHWPLAATAQEEQQAAAAKERLAATLAAQGIEVDLD